MWKSLRTGVQLQLICSPFKRLVLRFSARAVEKVEKSTQLKICYPKIQYFLFSFINYELNKKKNREESVFVVPCWPVHSDGIRCISLSSFGPINQFHGDPRCLSPGLELCEPSLRLMASVLAGLMTFAGELLLLAIALGCQTWRGLLGAGAAPLTLFLSYG